MGAPNTGNFGRKEDSKENKPMEAGSPSATGSTGQNEVRDDWRLSADKPASGSNLGARPNLREVSGNRESGRSMGETLNQSFSQVKENAADLAHRAKDLASSAGENMTSVLRRYPTQSMIVGLCLGVVLGVVISRRT